MKDVITSEMYFDIWEGGWDKFHPEEFLDLEYALEELVDVSRIDLPTLSLGYRLGITSLQDSARLIAKKASMGVVLSSSEERALLLFSSESEELKELMFGVYPEKQNISEYLRLFLYVLLVELRRNWFEYEEPLISAYELISVYDLQGIYTGLNPMGEDNRKQRKDWKESPYSSAIEFFLSELDEYLSTEYRYFSGRDLKMYQEIIKRK